MTLECNGGHIVNGRCPTVQTSLFVTFAQNRSCEFPTSGEHGRVSPRKGVDT